MHSMTPTPSIALNDVLQFHQLQVWKHSHPATPQTAFGPQLLTTTNDVLAFTSRKHLMRTDQVYKF